MASFYEMPVPLAKKLGPLLIPLSKIIPKIKKGQGGWFDPEKEKCIGDEEANQYIKRTYRTPWIIPEKV